MYIYVYDAIIYPFITLFYSGNDVKFTKCIDMGGAMIYNGGIVR